MSVTAPPVLVTLPHSHEPYAAPIPRAFQNAPGMLTCHPSQCLAPSSLPRRKRLPTCCAPHVLSPSTSPLHPAPWLRPRARGITSPAAAHGPSPPPPPPPARLPSAVESSGSAAASAKPEPAAPRRSRFSSRRSRRGARRPPARQPARLPSSPPHPPVPPTPNRVRGHPGSSSSPFSP
ncbi:formin-like protein 14 [Dromiciops gliroides]|uniref:formin-like protein 14 n=1 Tax=Dromiciops gliroides TaxID=33562 RepID=UPI001CC75235|nr:formin-like protein 14 [Dromiciops gliroides]